MSLKYLNILFFSIVFLMSCISRKKTRNHKLSSENRNFVLKPEFQKYFEACRLDGSIVVYDNLKNQFIVSDTVEIRKETLPASTFKIVNLLVALETRVISSENDIIEWPGSTDTVKYGYRPEIYHDMTVKEAFEVSAGWVFVELAKKIGKDQYKKFLDECNYGNGNLSQGDADFWNFGHFGISPINQVEFLKKLYDENLPFSNKNMDIVKRVMITNEHDIRAKTGWTRDGGINTGWWVGYVENPKGVYFFATRLLQDRKNNTPTFGSCRKEITKSIFKDLEIIK